METKINQSWLVLKIGDITQETADAIVNAANASLRGGGGVDGAIHRAGGPSIMEECRKIVSCPTGSAVITTAGLLDAKYVIHAVGPIYRDGRHDEERLLRKSYESCLNLASEYKLSKIVFPALSAGAYGYPLKSAARIALTMVVEYMASHTDIKAVTFCLFNREIYDVFFEVLQSLLESHQP